MTTKLFMLIPPPGSAIHGYVTAVDEAERSVFSDGVPICPPAPSIQIVSGLELADRLLTSGNELILSAQAVSVISRHRVDPQLVRCPIKLTSKNVAVNNWPSFELWYSTTSHDVLHKDAKVRRFKGHLLSVFEWVIDMRLIPSFDLFLAPTNRWIASERLVDSIFEARLSGFGFAAIPCVG